MVERLGRKAEAQPGAVVLLVLGFIVFVFLVIDAWRHKRRNRKPH